VAEVWLGLGTWEVELRTLTVFFVYEKVILETENMEERVAIMQRILEVMVVLQVRYSLFHYSLLVIRYSLFVIRYFLLRYRYQDLILVLWGRPPKTVENLNFARKTFGQGTHFHKATQHNDKLSYRNYLSLIEGTV
jgi:hypothetical protein